jgi:hypothetical protein
MHQPGYVQEGQEAIFGYLLLGVYYRRIPGETIPEFRIQIHLIRSSIFAFCCIRIDIKTLQTYGQRNYSLPSGTQSCIAHITGFCNLEPYRTVPILMCAEV